MIQDNIDFWREPAPGQTADLMIQADTVDSVVSWLHSNAIGHATLSLTPNW